MGCTGPSVAERTSAGRAGQGKVAVADRGHRIALPPALTQQRRAQRRVGLLGHASHQGKALGGLSFSLHLAADRIEVANLVTRHRTYEGAVEDDDGPARVRRCGLGRIVSDSRDLRCCLPVGGLKLQGGGMGAGAQALVVRWQDGQ